MKNVEKIQAAVRNNSITPFWMQIKGFTFTLPSEQDLTQVGERWELRAAGIAKSQI